MDYGITLETVKDIECKGRRVGDYLYDEKADTIYYHLPYPFPCKFAVKGLREITVTPWMLRLPIFLKYHNIDWLRQQLMQVRCVQNDAVLLHGAAWIKDNKGYLAVGFAKSGKTTRVLNEVRKEAAFFIADENIIVTKEKMIIPVKRKTSLSWHLAKQFDYPLTFSNRLDFVFKRLRAKLVPIFEPNIWVDLPFNRHSFALDTLIFLTEGKNKSLALLTDVEFPFFTNPVIQTYAYATGWDLDGIYRKYRGLLDAIRI